jgi:hypothetical protein
MGKPTSAANINRKKRSMSEREEPPQSSSESSATTSDSSRDTAGVCSAHASRCYSLVLFNSSPACERAGEVSFRIVDVCGADKETPDSESDGRHGGLMGETVRIISGNYLGQYGFVKSLSSHNRYTIVIGGQRSILKRRHQFKRDSSAQVWQQWLLGGDAHGF